MPVAFKKLFSYSLFFLFFLTRVWAQPCTLSLSGEVKDAHDEGALSYAYISIMELKKLTVSDSTGAYQFDSICPGTYTVRCSHIGCDPIFDTLKITQNTVHNFQPEHHPEFKVLIQARVIKPMVTMPQGTLTRKELDRSRGRSLGDGLKQITGVTTLNTGNNISKPVIHGLHSNRVLIMNNGIRQEGQQWGNEHAPEIDPFIADELSVVKGANSVRYGPDAIAGVILVKPKALPRTAGLGGELNLVGFSNGRQGVTSGMLEGNFKKLNGFRWRTQGSLKRGGNINAPDYYLKNTGVREYNFSAAAGYDGLLYGAEVFYSQFNTDLGIFSGSHIGNLTDLQRAFEAEQPFDSAGFTYLIDRPWQHIEHELTKVSAYVRTGTAGKLRLTYGRQYNLRNEYDKDPPRNDSLAALNLPALQFEITTHTGKLAWEQSSDAQLKTTVGISGIHQGNTYEGRYFIPNFRKQGAGAFLVEQWAPDSGSFVVEGGIRYDYIHQEAFMWVDNEIVSPDFRYNNLSGSLGGIYYLGDDFQVSANLGTAWRPPAINELFSNGLHHGAAAVEIGDTSLVRETAYNISLSGQYRGEKLQVYVDPYFNLIDNFIYLKPVLPPTLTIRGAFPTFHFEQVDARLMGLDFRLDYEPINNLKLISKAAFLRARNLTEDEWLILMPADRFENTLEYTFPERKNVKDAFVALTVSNVLRQTRVPANSDFVAPPAGYTLLNLEAGLDIPLGKQKMSCGIGVNNLLNTRYRDYQNRFRYYADEMGTNVSLRVRIPFQFGKQELPK